MTRARSSIHRTASLTDREIEALWRFRLTLIDLKPTVTPEQDLAAFTKDFRWPGFVWILREGTEVAGFFLQRGVPLTWEGEELLCLLPEYGFLAPHLRGSPIVPLAAAALTALTVARYPLRRKFLAASTYPPGYIAFRKAVRPFWTLRDPELPAWERGLLLHLAERVAGASFRPEDGTVQMRTIPFTDRTPTSDESRRLYADYVAANPTWQEGRGLFFLFPVSAGLLVRVMTHALERRGRAAR